MGRNNVPELRPYQERLAEPSLDCCGHPASSHCVTCKRCHAPAGGGTCRCETSKRRANRARARSMGGTMKKMIVAALAVGVLGTAVPAAASKPVVRPGNDYNGIAPTTCGIRVHNNAPTELHVGCQKSDGKARIRYRFTPGHGYPGQFKPARVGVAWDCHSPKCSKNAVTVSWRVHIPRTLRVVVRSAYVHIRSVSWFQKGQVG